jgi:ribosomal protein L37E
MGLPKYAASIPLDRRVNILCRGKCGKSRYATADLTKSEEEKVATKYRQLPDDEKMIIESVMHKQKATCAKCGYRASDPYNWSWQ